MKPNGFWKRMNPFRKERATSLVETLMAVGIVGIIVVGMSQFYVSTLKINKRAKVKTAMGFLARDIENKLRSPNSIYLSLLDASNVELKNCLLGLDDGCTSAHTGKASETLFALNYATGYGAYAGVGQARMTSPSLNASIYYNVSGLKCTDPQEDPLCVFKAETFFYVTCDSLEGSSCRNGPIEIHVGYRVSQLPDTLKDLRPPLPSLPLRAKFITHQIRSIFGPYTSSTCNPGAIITGYDRRGFASCKCVSPYVEAGVARNSFGPICRAMLDDELVCPPNKIFRGLTGEGFPNCLNPEDVYECRVLSGFEERCPAGYWVSEERREDCHFYCTVTKGNWTNCDEVEETQESSDIATSTSTDTAAIMAISASNTEKIEKKCRSSSVYTECNSDEARDFRTEKGEKRITDRVQPKSYTLIPEDHREQVDNYYPMGMICAGRTLTCCRSK